MKNKSLYNTFTRNFSTKFDYDLAVIGGGPAGKKRI
jgi:ribulose 1,5-bisphosphate synthetase/thiazole synthase